MRKSLLNRVAKEVPPCRMSYGRLAHQAGHAPQQEVLRPFLQKKVIQYSEKSVCSSRTLWRMDDYWLRCVLLKHRLQVSACELPWLKKSKHFHFQTYSCFACGWVQTNIFTEKRRSSKKKKGKDEDANSNLSSWVIKGVTDSSPWTCRSLQLPDGMLQLLKIYVSILA